MLSHSSRMSAESEPGWEVPSAGQAGDLVAEE